MIIYGKEEEEEKRRKEEGVPTCLRGCVLRHSTLRWERKKARRQENKMVNLNDEKPQAYQSEVFII